jgi:regulatory protein
MITVTEYKQAEAKGKLSLRFDNGITVLLYRSEARRFHLAQDAAVTDEEFASLLNEVVAKRARKRALHLLEQMDRTEHQLRRKLADGGYPEICIDAAIDYVKSYHYLDDRRYACTFVRCTRERMSRLRIRQKLIERGISRDLIELAFEEAYEDLGGSGIVADCEVSIDSDAGVGCGVAVGSGAGMGGTIRIDGAGADSFEAAQIARLLEKRHFMPGESDEKEFRRTYQYLLRRGYPGSAVLRAMKGNL